MITNPQTAADLFWKDIRAGSTRLDTFLFIRQGGYGTYSQPRQVSPTMQSRRWTSGDESLVLDLITDESGSIRSVICVRG